MSFQIPSANDLVEFIKDFTGSNNDQEIKKCIYMAELSMRNIELPALRSNPYDPANIGVADAQGRIAIPPDMNKPILFFKQGQPGGATSSPTGPWIVYDRIGDRDIITQGMIAQLYLSPVNVPSVIRGKFSEVGQNYQFLPYIGEGAEINLYYYKAWPLLFAPVDDTLIAATGTVSAITGGDPWTFTLTIADTAGLVPGDELSSTPLVGSFGTGNTVKVVSVTNGTTLVATAYDGSTPVAGSVARVYKTGQTVQNNAVLQTWAEGYVYGTLREYYIKRHNAEDAAIYAGKFDNCWNQVEDQNNLGKWSGGHTRLTSVWQPRQYRQYNIK
jgi:hypothetical protein